MASQILTYALIIAIIACPSWCGDLRAAIQRCHSDAGESSCCDEVACDAEPSLTDSKCTIHSRQACDCSASESGEDGRHQHCPHDTCCQGVCAGAVIEKPLQLDDFTSALCNATMIVINRASIGPLHSPIVRPAFETISIAGNQGRLLRTWQMSLLC